MIFNNLFSRAGNGPGTNATERTPLLAPADGLSDHKVTSKGFKRTPTGTSSESQKLGTFTGVFVPTTLNVLSILMFIRFGFILGQSGVLGMMFMLIVCYAINLITTMSVSAIASNGTVRGGGAYYLISRSLGPEFGGSIGLVLYLGFVFNTGLNAVGLVDCFAQDFGVSEGNWANWLPDEYWWRYLWASVILILCTAICLAGSALFASCGNILVAVLLLSTFSIPISTFFVRPFNSPPLGIVYTGLSMKTFKGNLMPHLTKGAAGSQLSGRETYQDLFGILFPATGGIFAGASMSGDLKNPSRSIPRGTLYGLALTFFSYTVVILAMAATISRGTFYRNSNALEDVNVSGSLVLLGEMSTSLFSVLMGVIGSAKLLQALARDRLVPGLTVFGQGTKLNDEPTVAIIFTFAVTQLTMLSDINQIATFVTMTYLMTFLVTNLACFLLKISSAPNFRPSFRYFNWFTAALGTVVSGATMFFVDGAQASGCIVILIVLFVTIHYTTAPKSWGDVSQSLIYHQVRKYLLRLSRQEHHVKYWRPQILLFVNDPRRSHKLIQFCNSLKKGALFILGHVIVATDFGAAVPEAKKQQTAWTKYIDFSKIKAFVSVAISPGIEWGTRNVVLGAGLGGMRPNIVVMGFYNLDEYRQSEPSDTPVKSKTYHRKKAPPSRRGRRLSVEGDLPTDLNRSEKAVSAEAYVLILEDLLLRMKVNVAIAKGFGEFEAPPSVPGKLSQAFTSLNPVFKSEDNDQVKTFIDLWPIQMSAEITTDTGQENLLTTNFDTYALILQMGCILHTVPAYHSGCILRVVVFVEYETDVEEERGRVQALLASLRIEAEVIVLWLASGKLKTYEIIVNGDSSSDTTDVLDDIETALKDDDWWQEMKEVRRQGISASTNGSNNTFAARSTSITNLPDMDANAEGSPARLDRTETLDKIRQSLRKSSVSNIAKLGVSLSMQTHRLDPRLAESHVTTHSVSESEDSDSSSDSEDDHPLRSSSESSSRHDSNSFDLNVDPHDISSNASISTTSIEGSLRRRNGTMTRASAPSPHPHRTISELNMPNFGERHDRVPNDGTGPAITDEFGPNVELQAKRESQDETTAETSTIDHAASIERSTGSEAHASNELPAIIETEASNERPRTTETQATTECPATSETQSSYDLSHSTASLATNDPPHHNPTDSTTTTADPSHHSSRPTAHPKRPSTMRHKSYPKLSSALVPRPVVATEDTAGPSIMFQTPSPPARNMSNPLQSIYERYTKPSPSRLGAAASGGNGNGNGNGGTGRPRSTSAHSTASSVPSGYPGSAAAQPLSFNNLPCRAQHLIINELMRLHSVPRDADDFTDVDNNNPNNPNNPNNNSNPNPNSSSSNTKPSPGPRRRNSYGYGHNSANGNVAVIFTTLPAPMEGTHESSGESLGYLGDLEVLCQGLPPMLMIHSDSISVTTSL